MEHECKEIRDDGGRKNKRDYQHKSIKLFTGSIFLFFFLSLLLL